MWIPTTVFQFNFALFRSFWYIFPHRHGCYAFSKYNSLFSTQNHNQPATTLNWAKLDTFQACEICLFRCPCSIGVQHPNNAPDHPWKLIFSCSFFFKNQKDAISTQPSLLCACAGCHVTHLSGRRTTALKLAPNFTSSSGLGRYSYRPFLSSENVIHLYLHIFTIHFCILYWFFPFCD